MRIMFSTLVLALLLAVSTTAVYSAQYETPPHIEGSLCAKARHLAGTIFNVRQSGAFYNGFLSNMANPAQGPGFQLAVRAMVQHAYTTPRASSLAEHALGLWEFRNTWHAFCMRDGNVRVFVDY